MKIKKSLGNAIKLYRKKKRMTQNDIAKKLGCDQSAVSYWEIGINTPSVEHLVKLNDILDMNIFRKNCCLYK